MPIPITSNPNHSPDGQARSPGWLKNATNFLKFIDVLIKPTQTIEDLLIQLVDETSIDTAVGVQLDVIGIILDLERVQASEPDAEYRARLHGRGGQLGQSGEPETVIGTFLSMTVASKVLLVELQPATIELVATVTTINQGAAFEAAVTTAMNEVVGGGIGTALFFQVDPPFLWGTASDADANGDLPAGPNGWGDDADADANGDILPGVGGGNFIRRFS